MISACVVLHLFISVSVFGFESEKGVKEFCTNPTALDMLATGNGSGISSGIILAFTCILETLVGSIS